MTKICSQFSLIFDQNYLFLLTYLNITTSYNILVFCISQVNGITYFTTNVKIQLWKGTITQDTITKITGGIKPSGRQETTSDDLEC